MTIKAVCHVCGCRGSCPSKSSGQVDPDAAPCASCGCRWCGPMTPEAMRRAAEAPLVALVAAVPKGLDPIGWRAAVLAVRECYLDDPKTAMAVAGHLASVLLGDCEATSVTLQGASVAYDRAIAPQGPRPSPERKIGGRAVRLTVDDGQDD